MAGIAIPDTLHGVLIARIDRLQDESKRVLQLASVIGQLFFYRVMAEIAREEQRLDDHLLALQREEMIRERAGVPEREYILALWDFAWSGCRIPQLVGVSRRRTRTSSGVRCVIHANSQRPYIFKHQLTLEAAYDGLPKKKRRIFHRQVAEALERLSSTGGEEQVGMLAHHWERAGQARKATGYLLRAGDQARIAYAHKEAIDYYRRAGVFLKEQGEYERAARTLKVGVDPSCRSFIGART